MAENTNNIITTQCCIAGGGPAGMMLGYLLARGGVEVIVLEKHKDFFRDFRGDTIHPSTSQLMHELGILDDFLKVPHQELERLDAYFNGTRLKFADFTHLPTVVKALGLMPQWDFLNFIKTKAEQYPSFHLMMETEATDIIKENGRVVGVNATEKGNEIIIKANLTVATDGRHSTIRDKAAMKVIEIATPIDVLWFRISKKDTDPSHVLGWFEHGQMMVMLERDKYWQCAFIIEKNGFERIKSEGLDYLKQQITGIAKFLADRIDELNSFDDVKLLSVAVNRLEKWYDNGLLLIGDAAHAMSPVGGVGINIAIQDAVATANLLYAPLKDNEEITTAMLQKLQRRREWPMKVIQKIQTIIQKGIQYRKGQGKDDEKPPLFIRIFNAVPLLRRVPAYIVGVGVRPEHVHTPEVK